MKGLGKCIRPGTACSVNPTWDLTDPHGSVGNCSTTEHIYLQGFLYISYLNNPYV